MVERVWPCRKCRRRYRTRRCGSYRRSRRLAGLGWRAGRVQRAAPAVCPSGVVERMHGPTRQDKFDQIFRCHAVVLDEGDRV